MAVATNARESVQRKPRDKRTGVVVSTKGDKTIRVRFDFTIKHPKYNKYFRRSTNLATHDERNEAQIGDLVEVMACRPISRTKCWRLNRILRRAAAE
jgi:small subunit ribosomal protein S17